MKKHLQQLASILGLWLVFSFPAHATVSEYSRFVIPYQLNQSEYTCLSQQIMQAEFGIPLASVLRGVFAETRTLHQSLSGTDTYRNINLLAEGATIPVNLNFDRFNEASGIYDYSFTLDMAAFNTLHGSSVSGRQKTINTAKLAIISIIKTAGLTHGMGKFRVWIKLDNLPAVSGLSGLRVYEGNVDWPGWPYTAGSALATAYMDEMINVNCP